MITITPDEFRIIARYVYELVGIVLDENKTYLVESRLISLVEEHGCASFNELYSLAREDSTCAIERNIIDRITTQETLFFRDSSAFQLLGNKIIPELIRRRTLENPAETQIPLNIWSAACSCGQEVYSLAIILKEYLGDLKNYKLKLLGSDVSNSAITKASYGLYNKFEIERGMPQNLLFKYFDEQDGSWKIRDEIRAMVMFQHQNLMRAFLELTRYDIILCRNVLMYFDQVDREHILKRLAGRLNKDGYLLLGASESIGSENTGFEIKQHSNAIYYQLKNQ